MQRAAAVAEQEIWMNIALKEEERKNNPEAFKEEDEMELEDNYEAPDKMDL